MKYLFFQTDKNPTHTRDADGAVGMLKAYPDNIKISGPNPVLTSNDGFSVFVTVAPTPEPTPEPQPLTQADCIALGKQHVQNAGYGADEKVICLNKLLKVKDQNALASYPKLVATYTWLETVQAMAVAGQVNFPPAPHTFEEVVAE
jgi:hypothetical protein